MLVEGVQRINLTVANLFNLLPAAQQYNSEGTDSDIAKFRSQVLSIKQLALRNAVEPGGKKTNPQSSLPLETDYSLVPDQIGGDPLQTILNVCWTAEDFITRDLELCLRDIEGYQSMKYADHE